MKSQGKNSFTITKVLQRKIYYHPAHVKAKQVLNIAFPILQLKRSQKGNPS